MSHPQEIIHVLLRQGILSLDQRPISHCPTPLRRRLIPILLCTPEYSSPNNTSKPIRPDEDIRVRHGSVGEVKLYGSALVVFGGVVRWGLGIRIRDESLQSMDGTEWWRRECSVYRVEED